MNLYLDHFLLDEPPFRITPTTEFFFRGGIRGEVLDALVYALNNNGGILAVTGEVGTGKTMMCRTLMEALDDDVNIVYIANPSLSGREILYNITEELGLEPDQDKPNLVRQLQNYLIDQYGKKIKVIVFIDEAQAMPDESLEEIRLLSNLESSRDKLMQIVMFGQPEFTEKITQKNMRQLRERITSHFDLKPFGSEDVLRYIQSRMLSAGYKGNKPIFTQEACQLIWQVSEGILRRVNILADKSLLAAFARGDRNVTDRHVQIAARDAGYKKLVAEVVRKNRTPYKALAAATLTAVLLGSAYYYNKQTRLLQEQSTAQATVIESIDLDPPQSDGEGNAELRELVAGTASLFENVSGRINEGPELIRPAEKPGVTEPLQSDGSAPEPKTTPGNLPNFDSIIAAANTEPERSLVLDRAGKTLLDNPRWQWMPGNSYLRRRLNATQFLLTSQPRDFYTVRLMTVAQGRAMHVENFLRDLSLIYPIRNIMVYPSYVSGNAKFVVTYGLFDSQWTASYFLQRMPDYVKGSRPHAQALVASQFEAASAW